MNHGLEMLISLSGGGKRKPGAGLGPKPGGEAGAPGRATGPADQQRSGLRSSSTKRLGPWGARLWRPSPRGSHLPSRRDPIPWNSGPWRLHPPG